LLEEVEDGALPSFSGMEFVLKEEITLGAYIAQSVKSVPC